MGTGYAAKARATALNADPRAKLLWICGRTWEHVTPLAQEFQTQPCLDWQTALEAPLLDVVFICTANHTHAPLIQAALLARKHVVVEYPLALAYNTGKDLIQLAQAQKRLLHIEHIELLSGIHQALRDHWSVVGQPQTVHYATLSHYDPAPRRWSFQPTSFGFPLVGAVSRISRLIDLLGPVVAVACQNHYTGLDQGYFQACDCQADLSFHNGAQASLRYAKGLGITSESTLRIKGTTGSLHLDGTQLTVHSALGSETIDTGSRRGLFQKDTQQVLDHLWEGSALYVTPQQSLESLRIASLCETAAEA